MCDYTNLSMSIKVETAPVSTPHNLDPAVGSPTLSIPTITRVMRHLVIQMLSEPEVTLRDTDRVQVLLDSAKEIPGV